MEGVDAYATSAGVEATLLDYLSRGDLLGCCLMTRVLVVDVGRLV